MTKSAVSDISRGYFGDFGGRFAPESLIPALEELTEAFTTITPGDEFQEEFSSYLKNYAGRPTPLFYASRLTEEFGGANIFLKREDLLHTGAHKINNTLGQILLARKMGKKRIIAETGAGQHGVATATVAAKFGMECMIYMGEEDVERQKLNCYRMQLLGAEVRPVTSGSRTLKDAMNEAFRDWVTNVGNTYYLIGSTAGPHPFPMMVRNFQSVIGREVKEQIKEYDVLAPDVLLACVGGGSNAMGLFHAFLEDKDVQMIGVEGGGFGIDTDKHAATLCRGSVGVLHGSKSYVLQDDDGQVSIAHSISAGLDYPGVGPEHSHLKETGRAKYVAVTDDEAVRALHLLCRREGIIPALESSHALAYLPELISTLKPSQSVVVNLSGRGDKDIDLILQTAKKST